MMKPWLDMVTHRILLRRNPAAAGLLLRMDVPWQARWVKPQRNNEDDFLVQTGGVISK